LTHCVADDPGRFEEFVKQFEYQHGRKYLALENIIRGDQDGIEGAKKLLIDKSLEEQARVRERLREQELYYLNQPRITGGRSIFDDGKC
jgi:hypothetical protein